MNDMYLDTDISFFDLEDNDAPMPSLDDAFDADVDGYGDFSEADELFDADDLAEIEEEERRDNMEEGELASLNFSEMDDDAEIAIGDSKVSKKELSELVRVREEIKGAYDMLAGFSTAMEQKELEAKTKYYSATLECDRQIEAIQRRMNDPMTNPSERGNLWQQMQNLETRKNVINSEAQNYLGSMKESRMEAIKQRYTLMNAEMSKEVSNWKEEGPKIQEYLVNSGFNMEDVHGVVSPAFARTLLKAMKYDSMMSKGKEGVMEKLKAKPQRAVASASKTGKIPSTHKQKLLNKLNKGEHVDSIDMFDLLED